MAIKTKLTLTVKKSVIDTAKGRAKDKGISLSRMFEEIFEEGKSNVIKTAPQRAAERLLQRLEKSKSIRTKDGKELIKSHVERKFA
jgi:dsRNA-specific ribonuclease